MQLKLIKFLLKILKFRPKLYHFVVLIAPLAGLFRLNHLMEFSQTAYPQLQHISLGKTAYAEAPKVSAPSPSSPPAPSAASSPSDLSKEFDPLTLDENQVKVLQALAETKTSTEKDEELDKLKKLVELGQEKISQQIGKLEKLKGNIENTNNNLLKEEHLNIAQTAKMYESMKAIEAAEIFNKLDLVVLGPIIKQMNAKKAAAIVAKMDPKKARYLTIELLRIKQPEKP